MKIIISIFICLLTIGHNHSYFVKGEDFKGFVFSKDHFVFMSIEDQIKRYTPSKENIIQLEKLIKINLKEVNTELINQGGDNPIIHKCLKKYLRQYVGFINKNGDKIIWVNFIWYNKTDKVKLAKDIINVMDGGSYYWNIKVNLSKSQLFELSINGIS